MKTVNSYLLKSPTVTLIDCGEDTDDSFKALEMGLQSNDLRISDIERIIITHAHVDHIGMASRMAETTNCEIWVSDLCLPWAIHMEKKWNERYNVMMKTMRRMIGKGHIASIEQNYEQVGSLVQKLWKPIDEKHLHTFHHEGSIPLTDENWDVIYAPGHSSTQTCFFNQRTSQLFSADMILHRTPTPVVEASPFHKDHRNHGILELIKSFQRFEYLPAKFTYPGHYEPIGEIGDLIRKQTERIFARTEECYRLIQEGTDDFMGLFSQMYSNTWSIPGFNMLIGYLDILLEEGRIMIEETDETRHFRVIN
jgi:glyoxylase-like metal-dependent hydrolase (beta-lactamase superfamily II)